MFKNNPIFFKDLLIALNSKQGKVVVFFFMFIYFIAFLFFLSEIKLDYNFYDTSNIGKKLFVSAGITQLLVLTGISFFRGLQSFTIEKSNKTLDFIKISPVSSIKFIIGKFLSSISFILLLFLISIPFLSIGLVLGGVNLSDILIYCIYTFSYTSFAVLFGMFISSLSKNTIFSILYGFISIPALLFFLVYFLGITTNYFEFNDFFKNGSENIFFSIFPITIFEYIPEKDTIINFFGLNIHYLFFHFAFFGIINYFLLTLLNNKYKEFSDLKVKTFSYIETLLLIILFSIFSGVFSTAIFGLVFGFLIFTYLFFIFNNSKYGIYKYIYFIILFILATIIISFFHGFLLNTTLIIFLIFLLFFTFSDFLKLLFGDIGIGIYNTIFLLFLALFFYIAPLIFTNLLNIKLKTINSVIKTSLYNDNILDFKCSYFTSFYKSKEYNWNSGKCIGITDTNLFFYYFLYLSLNLSFILSVAIANKRKD